MKAMIRGVFVSHDESRPTRSARETAACREASLNMTVMLTPTTALAIVAITASRAAPCPKAATDGGMPTIEVLRQGGLKRRTPIGTPQPPRPARLTAAATKYPANTDTVQAPRKSTLR